mmetsp:Transcript_34232/g.97263  ORF Transcript_34232/g.97263 Transcript_34232/m.97263 type:complete len:224 (-) Transcript_34232:361-1032(-)
MLQSLIVTAYLLLSVSALQPPELPTTRRHHHHLLVDQDAPTAAATAPNTKTRRSFMVEQGATLAAAVLTTGITTASPPSASAATASSSFTDLLGQIQQAQSQLDKIPPLIESEKWDSIRAILITPPLSDLWAKTNRPLVSKYAEELGNAGGDELAALEAKEELVSHLRYLDMSVYNNVFNPITVEGKSGATKELIRSYYEDPINEFKASQTALQELIGLSKDL